MFLSHCDEWREVHDAWSSDDEARPEPMLAASSHTTHDRIRVLLESKSKCLTKAALSSFTFGDEKSGEEDEEDEEEIQVETYNDNGRGQQLRGDVKDITSDMVVSDGKDLQGIPWERLHFSRNHYRTMRLRSYRNYVNVLAADTNEWREEIKRKAHPSKVSPVGGRFGGFFSFRRNHRSVNHSIIHFQLRNLVWAPTHNDVYTVYENCLRHYSPAMAPPLRSSFLPSSSSFPPPSETVLDLSGGPLTPPLPGITSSMVGGGGIQISTLCIKDGWIAIGGFGGELVLMRSQDLHHLPQEEKKSGATSTSSSASASKLNLPVFSTRLARSENGITNGLDIAAGSSALGPALLCSNNDAVMRLLDLGTFQTKQSHSFDWAINYSSMRPGGESLVAVVGDDPITHLMDLNTGKNVARLNCHQDYSFACAWHPGGILLATGNQDTTTAVWDVRRTKEPLARLVGAMGAVRSLRFSPCGRWMVMAEPADFVHIVDVHSSFKDVQQIDFFGEIAGISFSGGAEPCDASSLFIGIADMTYNSLLEYSRDSEGEAEEVNGELSRQVMLNDEEEGEEAPELANESEDEEMDEVGEVEEEEEEVSDAEEGEVEVPAAEQDEPMVPVIEPMAMEGEGEGEGAEHQVEEEPGLDY